jgi:ring-1,2-phenylacetyl-CoA epoxidase subunit PaaC
MKENIENQFGSSKVSFPLHLADNSLIMAQRLAEWCGHGPILEQDIAITNFSLDYLGQARNFYQYAATLIGNNCDEDKLAYFRTEREFKNCILVEMPNGDWGQTILKIYFFSEFLQLYFQELQKSTDTQIAAIAQKSSKEVTYHLQWSKEWVIRLGDGTAESHQRMCNAINNLWPHTNELFIPTNYENEAIENGIGVQLNSLQPIWLQQINNTFTQATLPTTYTHNTGWQGLSGKNGIHTEHMGYILTELQYLQRTYPGCNW